MSTTDNLGGQLGAIQAEIAAMRTALAQSSRRARTIPLNAGASTDASGNCQLNLGTCPMGYIWFVRNLVVATATWATAVNGYALVMPGAALASVDAAQSSTQVADYANQLPNVAFYGPGQLPVQPNEALVVYVSGATASTQYIANAVVDQHKGDAAGSTPVS
jgi:hypothetical protein